jgi:[ribosomal protein S5]-alanine N-acetyltransferase
MTLTGQRCIVRNWHTDDIPDLAFLANNRRVARNLRDVFPHPYSERDARAFVKRHTADPASTHFAIEAEGRLAGAVGAEPLTGEHCHVAEIGYWVGEPFWGRGIATEAVSLLVGLAFEQLGVRRLQAAVYGWNGASARVLEKNGFTREGCLRNHVMRFGEVTDQFMYGLLREEWTRTGS